MKIGSIVCFKSHPYIGANTSTIISGEHLMLPPLMVVVEILNIFRDEHSETNGFLIASRGDYHCRCTWFSSKTNQYEYEWFYSSQLNLIAESEQPSLQASSLTEFSKEFKGKTAAIKTIDLELGKHKSSLSLETSNVNTDKSRITVSSLLSFVGPVMHIVEVKENDTKEVKFDHKTGKPKKILSKFIAKCKWYNPSGEKFSEAFLPIECLKIISILSAERLGKFNEIIANPSSILKINNTIVKPLSISFRSGYFYLSYFDYLLNSNQEMAIDDSVTFDLIKDLYLKEAPNFNLISKHPGAEWKNVNTVEMVVKDSIKNNYYLRIHYKNREEKSSTRTLHNMVLHTVLEPVDGGTEPVTYLEAYCNLRKSKRYFKVDRITSAQQLNLQYSL